MIFTRKSLFEKKMSIKTLRVELKPVYLEISKNYEFENRQTQTKVAFLAKSATRIHMEG